MLIFVQSKERAKELYAELVVDNIRVDVIHSDLSQAQVSLFFSFLCINFIPYGSVKIGPYNLLRENALF